MKSYSLRGSVNIYPQKGVRTIAPVALGSINRAVGERGQLFQIASGNVDQEAEAKKQLKREASDQPIKYGCTLPPEGNRDPIEVRLLAGRYPFSRRYTSTLMAVAATSIAAVQIQPDDWGRAAAYSGVDAFPLTI